MINFRMQAARQGGFSLLEILIAFSILALSLGILLKIFSGGVYTAAVAEEYTSAVQIAESLMAKTGVETALQAGESSGQENKKYNWLVSVEPYITSINYTATKTMDTALFKVKVIVSWGDDSQDPRQVELISLKLVTGESGEQ